MGSGTVGSFGAIRAAIPEDSPRVPVAARGLVSRAFTGRTVVRNQGELGSCVGFAYAAALSIIHGGGLIPSPLALYYFFRVKSGFDPRLDSGAFLEPAARALEESGAGSEILWPYNPSEFDVLPDGIYRAQAADHRVSRWMRATTIPQAKSAISLGLPIVGAFDVPPGFDRTGEDGIWHDDGGIPLGGHSNVIVGYDDDKEGGSLLLLNSWGRAWGTQHPDDTNGVEGYWWMPYDVFEGPRVWDSVVLQTVDMEAGR